MLDILAESSGVIPFTMGCMLIAWVCWSLLKSLFGKEDEVDE